MYNIGWIVDDGISVSLDRTLSVGKWFPTWRWGHKYHIRNCPPNTLYPRRHESSEAMLSEPEISHIKCWL